MLRSRAPAPPPLRADSPLYRPTSSQGKGKGREATHVPGQSSDFLALDFGGPSSGGAQDGTGMPGQGFMQQELVQQQGDDQYLSQRSGAIETIESTVAELGQIFSQLATMVAIQGEQVTRIDADTDEIATNVNSAQT